MKRFREGEVALMAVSNHGVPVGTECDVVSTNTPYHDYEIDIKGYPNSEENSTWYCAESHLKKKKYDGDELSTWEEGVWRPKKDTEKFKLKRTLTIDP